VTTASEPATTNPAPEKPSAAVPLPQRSAEAAPKAALTKAGVSSTAGEVRITSSPAGAKVTVGGASQPRWVTPFTAPQLQPGKYDVTVAKAGYVTQKKEIKVEAGTTAAINFDLVLAGATLTVNSEPAGASIYLDGKLTGKLTPATLNVDKGKHKIEVHKEGFDSEEKSVELSDGEKFSFAPKLTAKNSVTVAEKKSEAKEAPQPHRGGFFGRIFGGSNKIPAGKGMVEIKTTPPGATIVQDGKPSLVHTPVRVPMDPGKYNVTLQLDGYKSTQKTFSVSEGKTTDVNVTLEKK
jgi:hypothetical protein